MLHTSVTQTETLVPQAAFCLRLTRINLPLKNVSLRRWLWDGRGNRSFAKARRIYHSQTAGFLLCCKKSQRESSSGYGNLISIQFAIATARCLWFISLHGPEVVNDPTKVHKKFCFAPWWDLWDHLLKETKTRSAPECWHHHSEKPRICSSILWSFRCLKHRTIVTQFDKVISLRLDTKQSHSKGQKSNCEHGLFHHVNTPHVTNLLNYTSLICLLSENVLVTRSVRGDRVTWQYLFQHCLLLKNNASLGSSQYLSAITNYDVLKLCFTPYTTDA